jgi:hypothetical protein
MLTLSVTLPSFTFLSYRANRMRPGAATALAAIGTFAVGLQLVLAATMGRGLPPGKMAAARRRSVGGAHWRLLGLAGQTIADPVPVGAFRTACRLPQRTADHCGVYRY